MGAAGSQIPKNEYELVVRACKDLEAMLTAMGADGSGIHEQLNAALAQEALAKELDDKLVRQARYLATMRNKLIHEAEFEHLPDRGRFVENYTEVKERFQQILRRHNRSGSGADGAGSGCVIS